MLKATSFLIASLIVLSLKVISICMITFEEVTSLHIWITISSLANKDPNNNKALIFRQLELNWINAPLDDPNDYIGLYLDSEPDDNELPVSVHKLSGRTSGQIISDYYLPQLDFWNATTVDGDESGDGAAQKLVAPSPPSANTSSWRRERRFERDNQRPLGGHSGATKTPSARVPLLVDECIGYCIAYHSRNKILARNCLRSKPNWMRDSFRYIGARALPSLMLPGTHNSGTYPKQLDKSVLQMISKYQLNQDESIFNQLVFGIRHLDLRVGYAKVRHRPERLWIYHDIFRTEVSVDEVFRQVRRFFEATTHEIVIMDFHRFTVGFQNENSATQRDHHAKLINLLLEQLGRYIVPSYLGYNAPLSEFVSTGKRLIVGYAGRSSLFATDQQQHSVLSSYANQATRQHQQLQREQSRQQLLWQANGEVANSLATANEEDLRRSANGAREESATAATAQEVDTADGRVGTRIYNKLKSLKLISHSFSKRSIGGRRRTGGSAQQQRSLKQLSAAGNEADEAAAILNQAALFFGPVRHLWPNKDTIEGLAQYMNETTCRKYFGELSSVMVELTPTVFGALADKYDGNRKLAQLTNRQVTDWIRERWLHCINIVASDFFLGNDLISLSIYANEMRHLHRNVKLANSGQCKSFKRVEHLLDKSKIPLQFSYKPFAATTSAGDDSNELTGRSASDKESIVHTSSNGNKILLRPMATSTSVYNALPRERRDSFVDNVSDGFVDLFSAFKRLLNL